MALTSQVAFIDHEISIEDLEAGEWKTAESVAISAYWNGEPAPAGRTASASMLWSASALYVRFDARRGEPLTIRDEPELTDKTIGLWHRDVCELFVAPGEDPRRYFEFEVAPTGEWVDIAIDFSGQERLADFDYRSGMTSAAHVESDRILIAMKIPWNAVGGVPAAGDIWRGNLYRCVGRDPNRGYLAWSPTVTDKPNFHVPERFGEFVFEG